MALPGETEAGSAGKQPCPGIVRRAHRDDDHGRGNERLAPTLHPIGSKDPDALKIPARRAASTLTRSVRSPVLAEPAHNPKNKGKRSYQPILTFLAETREYLMGGLRGGDRPTGQQIAAHLESAFWALPGGVKRILARADAGFYCW